MYKLAGLDAAFLYNETERSPQHIASIQVVEREEGLSNDDILARFKATVVGRLHRVPYFTNRLQFTPLNLDHPIWVRDPAFDIDHHIIEHRVAAPGGRREFEAAIAALHAIPLDRSRPLWQIWVLTGLEGGRFAYYNRVHHACLDGVSGQAAVQALLDETPDACAVPAPADGYANRAASEPVTSLLFGALENLARYQFRQFGRLFNHVDTGMRLLQRASDPSKGLGAAVEPAPHTRFNRAVHAERSYATGELPLADIKAIGKITGTTLNDVFLAICAGGLRRYFDRIGELPARSMIAGCPVSLRQPGDQALNNQVTLMQVSFATDEADPVKRLLKIAHSSAQAKGLVADVSGSYDADVAMPGLPALMSSAARLLEAANLADLPAAAPAFNMVVSNVPGPRRQLYSLGGRVLTHYPVSIPAHGQAVNVTVQSYTDQLFFGVTGCAKALPDAQRFRDDMLGAFAELAQRVLGVSASVKGADSLPIPLPRRERSGTAGAGAEPAHRVVVQDQTTQSEAA
jgi:WS/DGAT/MGAT family acyltransferase